MKLSDEVKSRHPLRELERPSGLRFGGRPPGLPPSPATIAQGLHKRKLRPFQQGHPAG